ncbi:fucolectin-like [Saccostrea cucullata]|uniref:fucolectin-like n=1 Tax=Saccostrea cuccullata TaxID=36930 RepID=UPI002ED48761
MAGSLTLVFLLVVCFAATAADNHHNNMHACKNVAYGKSAVQSSEYNSEKYPASNAVNGDLTDFSHTKKEKSAWLRIDLGEDHEVTEVEVFTRPNCCGGRLHDVDVRVGKTANFNDMVLCGHFHGPAHVGEKFSVWCPSETVGRYVQIQAVGGSETYLDPAEVAVWGHL